MNEHTDNCELRLLRGDPMARCTCKSALTSNQQLKHVALLEEFYQHVAKQDWSPLTGYECVSLRIFAEWLDARPAAETAAPPTSLLAERDQLRAALCLIMLGTSKGGTHECKDTFEVAEEALRLTPSGPFSRELASPAAWTCTGCGSINPPVNQNCYHCAKARGAVKTSAPRHHEHVNCPSCTCEEPE